MKTLRFILSVIVMIALFGLVETRGQWNSSGNDIYNTNAGNVGIGNNAPGTLLYVAKNMTEPTITVRNLGGIGGATYAMVDNASGANWKFKATNLGGFKIRDHANLMDVFTIEASSLANAMYIKQGGNIGLGLTNPQENLHMSGAVVVGQSTAAPPVAGTIQWNGTNFLGYTGGSWINLDYWNDPWVLGANALVGNPEFSSGPQPMSLSFAFPGMPNPSARLYVTDISAPGIFPHLATFESVTLGQPVPLDASTLYRLSNVMVPPLIDYSMGIYGLDGTFKLCNQFLLTPTAQGDNSTLFRVNMAGIADIPNQSRVRAYQLPDGAQSNWQAVMPNTWTPVNFDADAPLNKGWDEQNEFLIAPKLPTPPPPSPNAYFTATAEGYYQVNARTEFNMDYWYEGGNSGGVGVGPHSYVLIAIWVDDNTGSGFQLHAEGNKLQIAEQIMPGLFEKMFFNNAPNVSDVVYLNAGAKVAIYVYHTALTPMNLEPGHESTYVSIHKSS